MYNKKTVEDIECRGKRVLVRCDFNVPMKDGVITDDKRIVEALPTIKYLIDITARRSSSAPIWADRRASSIWNIRSHPLPSRLSELLGKKVPIASDVIGEDAHAKADRARMTAMSCCLRTSASTRKRRRTIPSFAKSSAAWQSMYVNDAFGTAHRAHASTAGVADYLPAVCGYLIQKEINIMGNALSNPKRPFVAILGGAKVSDKIGVINNLLDKVDTLIIGGGMAYTFIQAHWAIPVGTSLCEEDKLDLR